MLPHVEALPYQARRRFEVLQRLQSYRGQGQYREEEAKAAQELGVSLRSVKRLVRQYREQGIAGLQRQPRSDEGQLKIDETWRAFILKTYQQGNRGSRQMSRAQVAKCVASHAADIGSSDYPSRRTVYRVLAPVIQHQEQNQKRRSIGWQGDTLKLTTKAGIEIAVEYSNQVWQCDHTPADIVVVDRQGDILGCPTLTTVIDTYSRCIMGLHLGMECPSAAVTGLALRHAILPKQYPSGYEPTNLWESYGVPQYLYTDGGSDFTSSHIDQLASRLGIVLCRRRRPAEGGIVERPFGTFNSEFFSTLPGYIPRDAKVSPATINAEACLTVEQLEGLLIRYIVDNYNQRPDARDRQHSRIVRWRSGQMAQGVPPEERELDGLLMCQHRRRVYQGGYIRFANLIYRGEYLAGYAGAEIILRYDPRDITTVLVYQPQDRSDVFLTRAHAQNLETERLSLAEAKAISRRLREARTEITNQSILSEIRDRLQFIDALTAEPSTAASQAPSTSGEDAPRVDATEPESSITHKPLPPIRVYDYEQLRQEHGL
ncbi:DDE-type integrase/transposase/recombinase [filamentous cyanobacterium LEGE 07170]|nr:DDE-type integrase/transposase/recombinase [filamentous cyanobacterium LEGE 07170]